MAIYVLRFDETAMMKTFAGILCSPISSLQQGEFRKLRISFANQIITYLYTHKTRPSEIRKETQEQFKGSNNIITNF